MIGRGTRNYYQLWASANRSPTTNCTAPTAMAASQLIMSVITPFGPEIEVLGKWQASLWPTRRSAQLCPARLRSPTRPGPPPYIPFLFKGLPTQTRTSNLHRSTVRPDAERPPTDWSHPRPQTPRPAPGSAGFPPCPSTAPRRAPPCPAPPRTRCSGPGCPPPARSR